MSKIKLLSLFFLLNCNFLSGQTSESYVLNENTKNPIEFVNIGIIKKNVGTVSDVNGKYDLLIDTTFDEDTLLFSRVGYIPFLIKISDFKKREDKNIFLKEKIIEIAEVVVNPKNFKEEILGVSSQNKKINAGFKDNQLGYELGILMKAKKTAFIKSVNINIAKCSYDSIFYRLNIYEIRGKNDFENILKKPIYINLSKEQIKDVIQIDLQSQNIVAQGNFLVTLEIVKKLMGKGELYLCAKLLNKTYYRATSQGDWKTVAAGVSISVVADIEK